jgi:hypothetical protein
VGSDSKRVGSARSALAAGGATLSGALASELCRVDAEADARTEGGGMRDRSGFRASVHADEPSAVARIAKSSR